MTPVEVEEKKRTNDGEEGAKADVEMAREQQGKAEEEGRETCIDECDDSAITDIALSESDEEGTNDRRFGGMKGRGGSKEEEKKWKQRVRKLSANPAARLDECERLKALGTEEFKAQQHTNAIARYTESLRYILYAKNKPSLSSGSAEEKRERSLQLSLELNLSMCHIKLGEWYSGIGCANNVLSMAPENIKALYRRGLCRSNYGLLDEGRSDLMRVIQLDPENMEARQELVSLKNKIRQQRESDKKTFGNLFTGGGGSLYDDKEKERLQRVQKEEEERRKKREQWHIEMNQRQERGESELGFEDWCTEEDKKKKESEEKEKEEDNRRKKAKESERKPTTTSSASITLDTDALDEEEQKIINETKKMGYCYFRRDMTEDEKKLNALNKPQKIPSSAPSSASLSPPTSPPTTTTPLTAPPSCAAPAAGFGDSPQNKQAISSWNAKGTTYEEKDMTSWCVDRFKAKLHKAGMCVEPNLQDPSQLTELLQGLSPNAEKDPMAMMAQLACKLYKLNISTSDVVDVGGEGHISVVRGTRRYLFDLHATMKWKLTIDTSPPSLPDMPLPSPPSGGGGVFEYTGQLLVRDVSSAIPKGSSWLSESAVTYTTGVPAEHKQLCEDALCKYKENVIKQIDSFLSEYQNCV
eukprot:GHVS01029202.1.p1 GENE.GHVS01029202.1~~GHVS01029202.1.p1  ORF type:complete len:669 (+),score=170.04 GHVS01029202.1:89-2008(+)